MKELSYSHRRLVLVLMVVTGSVVWGVPNGSEVVGAATPGSLTDDTADPGEDVLVNASGAERDKQRPRRFVDADTDSETPVAVFVGETLNVSSVKLNNRSDTIGTGDVTLRDVDEAGAITESINGSSADFTDVEPGAYSADDNASAELLVQQPRISELSLFESKKENNEIVSGRIDGSSTVFLNAEWNFDQADKLELTVRDESGLDVREEVVRPAESESASGVVNATVAEGNVAESGQDVALNFSEVPAGEYVISASGSEFGPTASVTVTLVRDPLSMSFESETVIQGDVAVANISGLPGGTTYLRIDETELRTDVSEITRQDGDVNVTNETASALFYGSAVTAAVGGESLGIPDGEEASDDLIAVIDLGDDGDARVGVRTTYLRASQEVDVTLATPSQSASGSLADRIRTGETVTMATLNVSRRALTVQSAPNSVVTTAEFTITGTAVGVDRVAVYVRQDDGWHPVDEVAGDNVVPVSNGTFRFEGAADGRFSLPDSYLLGLVSVDEVEQARGQPIGVVPVIRKPVWTDFETRTSFALHTEPGGLSAYLTSESLVVDDEVEDQIRLRGAASGQGDTLRLYLIGPRGTLYADDVTGRSVDVANESVDYTFGTSLTREGTYHVLLVGRGRDGSFAPDELALRPVGAERRTAAQKREILTDVYSTPGSDDKLVWMSFEGVDPMIRIDPIGQRDRVPPTTVTISGVTNRGERHQIFITVFDSNGTVAAATNGQINATASTWSGSVNFSELEPGTYTVVAEGPDVETQREIQLVAPEMPAQRAAPEGAGETPAEPDSAEGEQADQETTSEPMVPSLGFVSSIPLVLVIFGVAILVSLGLLLRFRGDG